MPQIRCRYIDCVFLEDGYCGAKGVEIDPDEGCLTYTSLDDLAMVDDEDWEDEEVWEDDDLDELWEEDDEEV
jgi:hypothetical protein